MAEQVLEKSVSEAFRGNRPELRQVAEDILDTQQTEIDQMTQWRQDW